MLICTAASLYEFIVAVLQAFAWPACVKLISGWFPGRASSNVFGLYGTCTSVGGVAGTMVAVGQSFCLFSFFFSPAPAVIFLSRNLIGMMLVVPVVVALCRVSMHLHPGCHLLPIRTNIEQGTRISSVEKGVSFPVLV